MAILINIPEDNHWLISDAVEKGRRAATTGEESRCPRIVYRWSEQDEAEVPYELTTIDREIWMVGYYSGRNGFDVEF
jgi:hypothetical protein